MRIQGGIMLLFDRMNKKVLYGTLALLLAGLSLYVYFFLFRRNESVIDLSRDSVIKEIQALNRLETSSYTIEKIVEAGTKDDPLRAFFVGDRLLLIAHGTVVAGVDLSTITSKDVEIRGKSLSVTLPAPTIFGSSLDNSKTKVYDRTQGILTRGDKDLESEARTAAETSIRQAACDAGILKDARENAIERVRQLFEFAGFTEVNVNVPSGSC